MLPWIPAPTPHRESARERAPCPVTLAECSSRAEPYLALAGGLRFISELPSTFSVPAAGVVLTDVPFYDSATVGVFGGDLGFAYDVSPKVALGIEAGLRYQTSPSRLNGLAGTGLEAINDTGSRWSLPVLATVTFRF